MSVHARWRWGAAALVLLAVALVSGGNLCGVALDEASDPGMKPIGSGGLACAEFWLNRYQTFLGAIAALVAGYAAWRGAMTQVAKAEDQIKIVAAQLAIDRIDQINEKLLKIDALYNIMLHVERANYRCAALISIIREKSAEAVILIDQDEDYVNFVCNDLMRQQQEFIQLINSFDSYIAPLKTYEKDVFLAEEIRNALTSFITAVLAQRLSYTNYALDTQNELSPLLSRERLRDECSRIAEVELKSRGENIGLDRAAFAPVSTERKRLLNLRIAAEAAADI